jgi:RNA polymerase-binding transcription factor
MTAALVPLPTPSRDALCARRARDRQCKLIARIDAALARLEDGTYGYCEETGEPISLKRLEARPIATLSVEERHERIYRDE